MAAIGSDEGWLSCKDLVAHCNCDLVLWKLGILNCAMNSR